MNNLSVIILTFNEEKHIRRCIESILPITNKIYIIDSLSTDSTTDIANSLGAVVYTNPWPGNHAKQFQWALDNCGISTEWVMKLDADEIITNKLSDEISSKLINLSQSITGIYIKRRVEFMGRWIKRGGYYPTWLLRIWRYHSGIMEQRWMDEHVKLLNGTAIKFQFDIIDRNKNDLTWWISKHNNYATKEAADILNLIYEFKKYDSVLPDLWGSQEQRKRKLKHIYAKLPLFLRPFIYFIWRYFFKMGFLDRKQGLIWHFLQGFWYRFLVDAKIFEIYINSGMNKERIKEYLRDNCGVNFDDC